MNSFVAKKETSLPTLLHSTITSSSMGTASVDLWCSMRYMINSATSSQVSIITASSGPVRVRSLNVCNFVAQKLAPCSMSLTLCISLFLSNTFFFSLADYIAEEVFKCIGNRKTKLSSSTTLGRKILITKILSLALNAKSRGGGGRSLAIQIGRPTGLEPARLWPTTGNGIRGRCVCDDADDDAAAAAAVDDDDDEVNNRSPDVMYRVWVFFALLRFCVSVFFF